MPSNYLRKLAEERDMSMQALESVYEKARALAEKKFEEDDPQFYPYATGIFKRMLGMSSESSMVKLAKSMHVTSNVRSLEQCFMENK